MGLRWVLGRQPDLTPPYLRSKSLQSCESHWRQKNLMSRYGRRHHGGRVGGILSIRGPEVSLGSPRVGTRHVQSPTPHARGLPSVDTYEDRCSAAHLPNDLRNRRNLARGGYSSRPVPDLRGQARLRPPFTSFCTAGGDELARRGGSDRGGEVAWGPSWSTQPVEGRPVGPVGRLVERNRPKMIEAAAYAA